MIRRIVSSVVVAGVLTLAGAYEAGAQKAANPCAAKNPCAVKAANPCAAKNPCAVKNPAGGDGQDWAKAPARGGPYKSGPGSWDDPLKRQEAR